MRTMKIKLATKGKKVHNPSTASHVPGYLDTEECEVIEVPDAKYWHRMLREGSVVLAEGNAEGAHVGTMAAAEGKTTAEPKTVEKKSTEKTTVPDVGSAPKK